MSPERMREALHDLDMPSLRKEDDEVVHDLVDALVQRKAEAADTNPRKQAWRGRAVYMMRKAELQHMLQRFGKDSTGKAEELRTRFRATLREWAADEIEIDILIPLSVAGGRASGGGAGAEASDPPVEEDDGVSSSEERAAGGKRGGRQSRPARTRVRSEDAAAAAPEKAKAKGRSSKVAEKGKSEEPAGGGEERTGSRGSRSKRHRAADGTGVSPKRAASSSADPTGEDGVLSIIIL